MDRYVNKAVADPLNDINAIILNAPDDSDVLTDKVLLRYGGDSTVVNGELPSISDNLPPVVSNVKMVVQAIAYCVQNSDRLLLGKERRPLFGAAVFVLWF